ncbi:MAG: hypothetical protein V4850_30680 [Myxococcota bacterium]
MLLVFLLSGLSFAADADSMLGYAIGQPVSSIKLPKAPQGAFMTSATVAGEQGNLFLVPCGTRVHEIIFQVIYFTPDPGLVPTSPAARVVSNPRDAARSLKKLFEGALQAAGWLTTKSTDLGPLAGTTMVRNGIERSIDMACEPEDPAVPQGREQCRVSIHAGGEAWCTDGL